MLNRYNGNLLPFANSADPTKRYIFGGNTPSDNIDDNINANFLTGWEIVGLNEAPPKQWFNALGYTSTYLASYLYQVGIPEYNGSQKYYKNSIVNKDGIISVSIEGVDGTPNVGNDPATDKANWKTLATHTVDTLADLRALDMIPDTVWVSGYYAKGDGAFGSNIFEWDNTSTEDDNGGTTIKLDSVATGRYKLRYKKLYASYFGVRRDNIDTTTRLQALRDYMDENSEKLFFAEGIYSYSSSPNWAINNLYVEAEGKVIFRYTGTGDLLIFDNPTLNTYNINFCFTNPILLEGDQNSNYGVYVRSCHHSKIGANIRGCGNEILKVEFSVVNEYNIISSINEGPFTSTPAPKGISITRRNVGEDSSANIFYNPIIEGMRNIGISLDYALNNKFLNGTSEANAGANIECSSNTKNNTFDGIDLEVSGISQGFIDRGKYNNWINIFNDANSTITSTAVGAKLIGGIHNAVINQGEKTVLKDFSYGAGGGEISDTGSETTIENAYDIESASYKFPNKQQGKITFTKEITVGAFAVTPSVPGNITKTNIPLANVNIGDNVSIACLDSVPTNFTSPTAIVTASGIISITFSQLNGTAVSPLPTGGDFIVTVN